MHERTSTTPDSAFARQQKHTFKKIALCTLLGGSLFTANGAAWCMDLLQAYDAARLQDATILASRATAAVGRERLPQARSQLFPSISANLQRTNNRLQSTTPNFLGVEQTQNSSYPSSNQTVTLRQPLYRPFNTAQLRQARAQIDDVEATLEQDEQSLAVRVASAYFEALLSLDQLALVEAQRKTITTQLDFTRKTFSGGTGTRTDIDETQARLDQIIATEIEARQNVDFTRRQLEVLVNQPVARLSKLDILKLQVLDPQPNSLEAWTDKAEQSNPQLKSLRAQLEAAREDVSKASSGHKPTLDAVVQWQRSQSENVTNFTNRYTNSTVGLQLSIPIFQGGYVSSQVRQAVAAQERASQLLEAGRRDLGVRIFREFRGVLENVPKVKALERALASAEQLVVSNRKSFQAGSRTVVDILNAEQQRTLVLRDLAQARYVYLVSKLRLLALVGEADQQAVMTVNAVLQ
jgi:outer membrane protein/protease secretion system outer membrane protein